MLTSCLLIQKLIGQFAKEQATEFFLLVNDYHMLRNRGVDDGMLKVWKGVNILLRSCLAIICDPDILASGSGRVSGGAQDQFLVPGDGYKSSLPFLWLLCCNRFFNRC